MPITAYARFIRRLAESPRIDARELARRGKAVSDRQRAVPDGLSAPLAMNMARLALRGHAQSAAHLPQLRRLAQLEAARMPRPRNAAARAPKGSSPA